MTTTTAGKSISTRDATVKTATVEVKTITISGKQVTLAFFRQLKYARLIDEVTGQFRGLPWGTVNYCTKDCSEYDVPHRHVLWQLGNELRVCVVMKPGGYSRWIVKTPAARWLEIEALDQLFIAV